METIAQESISALLGLQPAFKNLFEVWVMDGSSLNSVYNTRLFCKSVRFASSGVEFERHKVTQQFVANGYQPADTVTISWIETQSYDVYNFHYKWLDTLYERETYRFKPQSNSSIEKNFEIHVQKVNIQGMATDVGVLKLSGVLPPLLPEFDFDYSVAEAVSYTFEYKVKSWLWIPSTTTTVPPSVVA